MRALVSSPHFFAASIRCCRRLPFAFVEVLAIGEPFLERLQIGMWSKTNGPDSLFENVAAFAFPFAKPASKRRLNLSKLVSLFVARRTPLNFTQPLTYFRELQELVGQVALLLAPMAHFIGGLPWNRHVELPSESAGRHGTGAV